MFSWFRSKEKKDLPQSEPATLKRLITARRNKDEFVLTYVKLLEERQPGLKCMLIGPTAIEMRLEDDKPSTAFLDNLFIQVQGEHDPSDLTDLIERHIRSMLAMLHPEPPIERRQLIPTIKDKAYVDNYSQITVHEHYAADLYCVYAIDREDSIKTIGPKELDTLQVDRESLRTVALDNLRAILPPAECHGEGPWFFLTAGNDYVASLILFDNLWDEQLAGLVEGDLVAVVPSRDVVLFTGSGSTEGIAAIRQRAKDIVATGDHIISDTLLRRSKGRWSAFD